MATNKKRFFVMLAVALLICSAVTATVLFAAGDASELDPKLEVVSYNLSYSDSVYILYAIANEGFDREEYEIKMLFWNEAQDDYVLGTESYSVSTSGKATVKGKDCLVFYSEGLAAKEMTDDVFCRAYVTIGNKVYYGETVKFSVLEFVHASKEKGELTANQIALFDAMLDYGAAAQKNFGYKADTPANGVYHKVSVIGGTLADGFTVGRVLDGKNVQLIAPAKSGELVFSHWENVNGDNVADAAAASVPVTEVSTYTAVYEPCTEHSYVEHVLVRPTPTTKGSSKFVCSKCGDNYTEEVGTTLKLLAIGNSFSEDSLAHLYLVAKDAGIENVVIGHLYKGGCSLETHWNAMNGGASAHEFMLANDSGAMVKQTANADRTATNSSGTLLYYYRPEYVISYTDWDYITLQQVSGSSGLADTYSPYLENIVAFVNQHKTNENAKLYWHMTWAYQADSTKSEFASYGNDQMTMYNGILNAVNTKILTNSSFDGVIPSGTAIQNLRTSHLGDNLTRDGYHLDTGIGRYTASLTWLATLTGIDISDIDYVPSSYTAIGDHLDCIKDAVKKAIAKPYEITESAYPMPDEPDELLGTTLSPLTEEDRTYLTSKGYDPDAYMILDLTLTWNSYYDTSKDSGKNGALIVPTGGGTLNYFISTQIFARNELVNGTLIRVDEGYRYRPDGWVELGIKNGTGEGTSGVARPGNVSTALVVVDDKWWGSFTYRGFNISRTDGATITESEGSNFKIYIPVAKKSELTEEDKTYLTGLGLNADEYKVIDYDYTLYGYYDANRDSTIKYSATTALNKQFLCANQIYSRYDITLGSVIRNTKTSSYQYRPEGWITLNEKVESADRPARVTAETTIVDAAWWGDWGYRAFNIQTKNSATMTDAGASALRIYVKIA